MLLYWAPTISSYWSQPPAKPYQHILCKPELKGWTLSHIPKIKRIYTVDILQDPRIESTGLHHAESWNISLHLISYDLKCHSAPCSSFQKYPQHSIWRPHGPLPLCPWLVVLTLSVLCHRENLAFISSKVKSMTQEFSNSYQVGINVAGQFALSPLFYLSFIYLYFILQLSRLSLMSTNCFDKLQWFPCASFANTVLNSLLSFNGALRVYTHVAVTSGRNLGRRFQAVLFFFFFACIATVPLPLCHNLSFKERSQAEYSGEVTSCPCCPFSFVQANS